MSVRPFFLFHLVICFFLFFSVTFSHGGGGAGGGGERQRRIPSSWRQWFQRCKDPAQAVLDLLTCVGDNDITCSSNAYDPAFQRYHNELFTGQIDVQDPSYWQLAFDIFPSFSFDIKFIANVGLNKASVRYIETVTSTNGTTFDLPESSIYPFNQSVIQHEHALVQVDDDCKIVKWDQYGDNKEQTDVDAIVAVLVCTVDPTLIPEINCSGV